MQAFQENFSYLSNYRLETDKNLENERQLLVQEQKLCKVRARRFSQETNRRRKALDERRKQWDIQEERLRENVLKERRQQVQDATERFQRAHLPPSQRQRQPFGRNAPNIEDALNQIQGTLSLNTLQSSPLSSTTNISRTYTPSPKNPTGSKLSHRQALSAVEAYTKLLQEQCRIEKLQANSLQGSLGSDCCFSDSLLSKDSLEGEDPNESTSNPQCSFSSFILDSEKSHSERRKENDLCPTSTSISALMLLDENLAQLRKLHEPKQEKQDDAEWTNNHTVYSEASFTSLEKTPKTEKKPKSGTSDLLTLCKVPKEKPEHFEVKFFQKNPESILVTNRVVPGDTAESLNPKPETLVKLKQQMIYDDSQLKHQLATDFHFPSRNGSSKDILFGTPPKSTAESFSNVKALPLEKEAYYLSPQKEPLASMNNLNKVPNSDPRTEKSMNPVSLHNASLSNIQSETNKCHGCPEEEEKHVPIPKASSHSACDVRFIKGILKNQSRSTSRDASCWHGPGHLVFAKQVALAIRDSVELTREKTKDVEVNNQIKKKLRWFDEVHTGKDHQPRFTTESGSPKPGPNMTLAASTGYHFTKEAWADVGVQVNLPQERADEVKVAHSSTKTNGPKVPRRVRSARLGGGPVPSRTRKGTVIRPQSATEVNQIAKTQGKNIVPRPPPRTESTEEKGPYINRTPSGMNWASISHKQAPVLEEALPKNNSVRGFPANKHIISTDMNTALPHSCTYHFSEVNTKDTPLSGHQESHHNRERGAVCREKGLCLDVTPTDEEISQLWHGVRSALNTKDEKSSPKNQTLESRQVPRNPHADQSRQPPASGNRRFLQTSQPVKQKAELLRTCSRTCNAVLNEGFETAAQFYLSEVPAEGLSEENQLFGAMDSVQTLRSGTVQQRSQQQGLTTISSEEKKILLSLDRLNHQLYSLQEHMQCQSGTQRVAVIDAPFTKEEKVTNNYKQRVSSANPARRQKND